MREERETEKEREREGESNTYPQDPWCIRDNLFFLFSLSLDNYFSSSAARSVDSHKSRLAQ